MHDWRSHCSRYWPALLATLVLLAPIAVRGQQLSVRAAVEGQEFFLGESFTFQIQVNGDDSPHPPDTSVIREFTVQTLGARPNNSTSVSIINGRYSKSVTRACILSYKLTPRSIGQLTIPPIHVVAGGKRFTTQAVPIVVRKAEKTNDSELRMTVSRPTCYVGEPITLDITWYFAQNINEMEYAIPSLDLPQFDLVIEEPQRNPGRRYHGLQVGSHQLIAEQGQARLKGKSYATLGLSVVLIPKQKGVITLPKSTVVAKALVGYRNAKPSSRRSPFGGFFGGGRQGVYKKIVVPSNSVAVTVKDVPTTGRPANFAGHMGRYALKTAATPTDVSVGDPITLTISISGPSYLEHIELPPLHLQKELAKDFKIPEERATGKIQGKTKVFTQTVRALHANTTEIPSLELPYFDTTAGSYAIARSKAIPIAVKETRVVTADDAEGVGAVAPAGRALKAWGSGILHNYDDLDVLVDQRQGPAAWLQSPRWISLLAVPPGCYFVLLFTALWVRHRHADPLATRARQAGREFRRQLKHVSQAFSESGFNSISTE